MTRIHVLGCPPIRWLRVCSGVSSLESGARHLVCSVLVATPIVVVSLAGCALENTGTSNGVGAGDGVIPYSTGGAGVAPQGNGGVGTNGGAGFAICGNGRLDVGEVCDGGDAETPPRNLCVDCQIDAVMLYSVAGTTNPPSLVDGEHRLHLYYPVALHTFEEAAADCAITGAHLVTILNDDELAVATDLLDSDPGWVGARDLGTPEWTTEEPWGYLPPGGYVTDSASETCIVFDPVTQELRDLSCSEVERGLCEWVAPGKR